MNYMKNLKEYGLDTDNRTYIIAEIGLNHGGDLEVAKKLIESAAKTGADAVKFQTYKTEKRVKKDSPIFDILKKCELPFENFDELKEFSEQKGIKFFSTPFDEESIDYLDSVDCEIFKVASFDVVNQKLLKKISGLNKTVIISVGMSSLDEIKIAYNILNNRDNRIILLHCISAYPTREEDANLSNIFDLKKSFDCVVGQSDHTNDIIVPLYAVAAGAQVIEKHYRIDENMDCVDTPVSITEQQMTKLVEEVRRLEKIMGRIEFGLRKAEEGIEKFRRYSK